MSFCQHNCVPKIFIETCRAANQPADVRFHKGYDHSYYFIASFIGEHIAYHAAFLK